MTIERVSLEFRCKTKGCPWPKDEEIHRPWCLGIPDVPHRADQPTHQHHPKKGMGGNNPKSRIVAILCSYCHDRIDNADWGNNVGLFPSGERYVAWDLHGDNLINHSLEGSSSVAEPDNRIERPLHTVVDTSSAAEPDASGQLRDPIPGVLLPKPMSPPPAVVRRMKKLVEDVAGIPSSESDGEDIERVIEESAATEVGQPDVIPSVRELPSRDASAAAPSSLTLEGEIIVELEADSLTAGGNLALTHEQRINIAASIRADQQQRQWVAGDTANQFVQDLGEEAWQYLDDFGYTHMSLSNIMHVCEAIPSSLRNDRLSYSHHVIIYKTHKEGIEMSLSVAEQNGWTVREFRAQVHGEPPRAKKKWTVDELRDWARDYAPPSYTDIHRFLDWLEIKQSKEAQDG